jgi:ribosomal protein L18
MIIWFPRASTHLMSGNANQDLASQNVPTSLLTRNNFRLVVIRSGSSVFCQSVLFQEQTDVYQRRHRV